jgi:hypothetical protein
MSNWHALHYNKIAKMLREKRAVVNGRRPTIAQQAQTRLLNELTLEFVEYFKNDNVVFDERKFIEACGYKP